MDKMLFADSFKFVPTERMYTEEGYLIAPALIARPGIQLYRGADLKSHPDYPEDKYEDSSVVRVYRPPSEVFNVSSINSFKNVPITDEHPPKLLNAKTVREYQRGTVLSDVTLDEENGCLKATIKVTDEEAVTNVRRGKCEMSAGYRAAIVFQDGVTEEGEAFDAIQEGIEGNHVAIVAKGRAGSKVKIADGYTVPVNDEVKMPNITVSYDGCSYEVMKDSPSYFKIGSMISDSEAEFIRENKVEKEEMRGETEDEDYNEVNAGKPNKKEPVKKEKGGGASKDNKYKEGLMDVQKELDELKLKYAEKVTECDELSTSNEVLTAEADVAKTALVDAQSKIPTIEVIDSLVVERQTIVGKCKGLVEDISVEGKTNADLKKEVVVAKMEHVDADSVSEAYIDAAFDLLDTVKVEVKVDKGVKKGKSVMDKAMEKEVTSTKTKSTEPTAREKFLARNREAYKK